MSHVSPRGESLTSTEISGVEQLMALPTTPAGQFLYKTGPNTFATAAPGIYSYGETPTGAIDGINTTYTLTYAVLKYSMGIWVGSVRLRENVDYTINYSGNSKIMTMTTPIQPSQQVPGFQFESQYWTTTFIPS